MDTQDLAMTGYRLLEYRLVLPLSTDLQDRVQALRQDLHERHKLVVPFTAPPSLTLLKYYGYERGEARVLEALQSTALHTDAFAVKLRNFAAYPSHTIYIDVATKSPFHQLSKELKKHRRLMSVPQHEPHFINEPHLLLAQNLKPMQFIRMWMECEHTEWSGAFVGSGFQLLRRAGGEGYALHREMPFMQLPERVQQGSLFG